MDERLKFVARLLAHLREVLEAWSTYRSVPNMAKGLAETAAETRREAIDRAGVGKQLAAMTAFRYLAEDDLTERPITMRGEKVERIAYYALETKDSRHIYRFRLTQDGRVVNFDSEER